MHSGAQATLSATSSTQKPPAAHSSHAQHCAAARPVLSSTSTAAATHQAAHPRRRSSPSANQALMRMSSDIVWLAYRYGLVDWPFKLVRLAAGLVKRVSRKVPPPPHPSGRPLFSAPPPASPHP